MHMVFFVTIDSHGVELVFFLGMVDMIAIAEVLSILAIDLLNILSAELLFRVDVLGRHSMKQSRGWNSVDE